MASSISVSLDGEFAWSKASTSTFRQLEIKYYTKRHNYTMLDNGHEVSLWDADSGVKLAGHIYAPYILPQHDADGLFAVQFTY